MPSGFYIYIRMALYPSISIHTYMHKLYSPTLNKLYLVIYSDYLYNMHSSNVIKILPANILVLLLFTMLTSKNIDIYLKKVMLMHGERGGVYFFAIY